MKYVVILGDGMADYPIESLGGKTPLAVAKKPYIDSLAKVSEVGLAKTVPLGLKPGSDVANLSVLGYDPLKGYTGRSPLEAASIGIDLKDTDVTARANLVTVSNEENYADKTMVDYSAGEITTAEAKELIDCLKEYLDDDEYTLYSGISYRHCLVVDNGKISGELTPPHDITGRPVKEYLPKGAVGEKYLSLMEKSHQLLKDHPVNLDRIKRGKNPANSPWLWSPGRKPALPSFEEKWGVKAAVVCAVDLIKGIGVCAGCDVVNVEGATGNFSTNYRGKAEAGIAAFADHDLVYIHVEAPDECGHQGNADEKTRAVELIDSEILAPVWEYLKSTGEDYKILLLPDHPTPIEIRTHSMEPVPFVMYSSKDEKNGVKVYTEEECRKTGIYVSDGSTLMGSFIEK